jgi:hypothetical protein
MHYLMLITLTMLPGETSEQGRNRAFDLLQEDRSFCGDGGRFGHPLCDWFVIGGRWSGFLRKTLIGELYRDALKQRFPDLAGEFYRARDAKAHGPALDEVWLELGGAGPSPFNRDAYAYTGDGDDALPVDQALYDRLLAEYAGQSDGEEGSAACRFADLDGDEVDGTFIGRKWIAVVDYHN